VTGSQLTPEERSQLNYQDDPFQPEGGLDCDPQQTLPGN